VLAQKTGLAMHSTASHIRKRNAILRQFSEITVPSAVVNDCTDRLLWSKPCTVTPFVAMRFVAIRAVAGMAAIRPAIIKEANTDFFMLQLLKLCLCGLGKRILPMFWEEDTLRQSIMLKCAGSFRGIGQMSGPLPDVSLALEVQSRKANADFTGHQSILGLRQGRQACPRSYSAVSK
jgi:hypothetical protein